jgi:predicted nucleic acid-binding Zn ribbon protein
MSPVRPLPPDHDGYASEPRRVGDSLERLARRLGAPAAGSLAKVFTGWDDLVGAQLASHIRPVSLVDGVLTVAVDDPAWATEVRFLAPTLLERVNTRCGAGTAGRIEVRVRRS